MSGSNLLKIVRKISIAIGYSQFVLSYYLLFVIWYYFLFVVRYLVLHAQIMWITNSDYSITTRHFFEKNSNSINPSLILFLSVLTQYFIDNQCKSCEKANTGTFLLFCMFICLRQEIVRSFWKTMLPVIYGLPKLLRNKNCWLLQTLNWASLSSSITQKLYLKSICDIIAL